MLVLLGILILPRFFGVDSSICHLNCVIRVFNGTDHCNSSTGQCLYGCQPGYAGPNCTFVCSSHCEPHVVNETETCNDTTGECLYGCQSGYAGSNCSVECPHTCASRGVRDAEICNATSKECLYGCQDGYYGARCYNECDSAVKYCKRCSLQSDHSVICDECIHNSYRYNGKCTACNYWCMVNVSSPLPVCREKDGYCVHGCKTGRYGFICGDKCEQCKDRCDRDLGHCLTGCSNVGLCGPTCKLVCNDGCAPRDCEQSCTCRLGCIRNKWGDQCDEFCNDNCNAPPHLNSNICERLNGTCSYKCKNDTMWGYQCDKTCCSNCNGGICEQSTGKCTGGCNSKEVYGIGCDKACNKNCLNGTCERYDGYCDNGCVSGSYGVRCQLKCNERCQNHTCSRANGYCLNGCTVGWRGQTCDIKCNDYFLTGTCEQGNDNCTLGCVTGWYGDQCTKLCSSRCLNHVCKRNGECTYGLIDREEGNASLITKLVAGLVSGWLLSLVLFSTLCILVVIRYRHCRVCSNPKKLEVAPAELVEHEDRVQHEYMTLQNQSSRSNQAACYETLDSHEGLQFKACQQVHTALSERWTDESCHENTSFPPVPEVWNSIENVLSVIRTTSAYGSSVKDGKFNSKK